MNDTMQSGFAASHATVRMITKRLAPSPYFEKYVDEATLYGIYANRLFARSLGDDPVAAYRRLRRDAMLYDVPEKPIEVRGPGAVTLLERVFTRPVGTLRTARCRYVVACAPDGGIVMDAILIRHAVDHFTCVHADGLRLLRMFFDGFRSGCDLRSVHSDVNS